MKHDDDDPEAVQRYPLQWPHGWRRTSYSSRKRGTFKRHGQALGVPDAVRRLQLELDRLGAKGATLSTNMRARLDGGLVANAGEPGDPGVAIYFRFKGRATVLACDGYDKVAHNVNAIALHIEALRAIERHGVGTIEQALAGYRALPADTAADWRQVLGFSEGSRPSVDEVHRKFKDLAREKHPDKGGTDEGFAHIQRARDYAIEELTTPR